MKQIFLVVFVMVSSMLIVQAIATDEAINVKVASPEDDLEVAETHYRKYKQNNYRNYRPSYQQPQPVYVAYAIVPVYATNGGGNNYKSKHHG